MPPLYHNKWRIDDAPDQVGELRSSNEILEDASALCARMEDEGYLLLRGLLKRSWVDDARRAILEKLNADGFIDRACPLEEGVAKVGKKALFNPAYAIGDPHVERLLYTGNMMEFFERFLGGPVRHFDYTWLRTKIPGAENDATPPHCDRVYMSRGTENLFTAWTPFSDISREFGGLMLLENSHRHEEALGEYWAMDVDSYCLNGDEAKDIESGKTLWAADKNWGVFDRDPVRARERAGNRWLTTDYQAGDVLVFSMRTLHASLNNQTNRVRISTDSRYQPATEPADERWIGDDPPGHGTTSKIGMIC